MPSDQSPHFQLSERETSDALLREINWYRSHALQDYEYNHMCQCGTEELFSRFPDSGRMRAFLLVSIFVDQLIYTHYQDRYQDFARLYPIPKLYGHTGGGHASPNWLIYSYHGFNKNADWSLIYKFAEQAIAVIREFLNNSLASIDKELDRIIESEIRNEFEAIHQPKLIKGFLI